MTYDAVAKPKQSASAKPSKAGHEHIAPAPVTAQRLTPPLVTEHYFGEQVIGSNETWSIGMPWNLDGDHATVRVVVAGSAFALVSSPLQTLPSSRSSEASSMGHLAPAVVFHPSKPGEHRGALAIHARWPDGHVEVQRIELRGAARTLDDVPRAQLTDEEREAERKSREELARFEATQEAGALRESKREDRVPNNVDKEFESVTGYVNQASNAADGLARAQKRGLDLAEREAMAYQRYVPPIPRNYWLDLAAAGLTVATGSIAGIVGGLVTSALGHSPTVAALAAAGGVPSAGGAAATGPAPVSFGKLFGDSVAAGLRTAGALAIAAGKTAVTTADPAAPDHDVSDHRHSANQRIDFFVEQVRVLDEQAMNNRDVIIRQARWARPQLRNDPKKVKDTFLKVAASLKSSMNSAEDIQAAATAAAWTSLIARIRLGSAKTPTGGVTNLEVARPTAPTLSPRGVDGILDLSVRAGTQPSITRARLNGVSSEIVTRLSKQPLAALGVPVRIVYGVNLHAAAIVTRDEAGRVRVSGNLEAVHAYTGTKGGTTEAEAIASATALVVRILSQGSLQALGVPIAHDDATGLGDGRSQP
jgi:hypothetical protein